MARQTGKPKESNGAVIQMRKELASKVAALAPSHGETPTPVPGLSLYRRSAPTPCFLATYEPSLSVFVQGRKRVNLGGDVYFCDGSSFLLSSIDVPAESQIVEASEQVPLLSMFLRLDMQIVREVISREDLPEAETSVQAARPGRWRDDGRPARRVLLGSSSFSTLPKISPFSAT